MMSSWLKVGVKISPCNNVYNQLLVVGRPAHNRLAMVMRGVF
jgi:hypothetical protein